MLHIRYLISLMLFGDDWLLYISLLRLFQTMYVRLQNCRFKTDREGERKRRRKREREDEPDISFVFLTVQHCCAFLMKGPKMNCSVCEWEISSNN